MLTSLKTLDSSYGILVGYSFSVSSGLNKIQRFLQSKFMLIQGKGSAVPFVSGSAVREGEAGHLAGRCCEAFDCSSFDSTWPNKTQLHGLSLWLQQSHDWNTN